MNYMGYRVEMFSTLENLRWVYTTSAIGDVTYSVACQDDPFFSNQCLVYQL